jgi:hypothetical protein
MTIALGVGFVTITGCKDDKAANNPTPAQPAAGPQGGTSQPAAGGVAAGEHGHSHERGKMKLADAGDSHALLTAHLSSKDGNELDIFLETADERNPKPVAIADKAFVAQARADGGEFQELKFEPAPADERPRDEKPGTASHFVAKAPWMKPTDNLYVVVKISIGGKEATVEWKDFNPKKFAHHED